MNQFPRTPDLRDTLEQELVAVKNEIVQLKKLQSKPQIPGHLRISNRKGHPQYFHVTKKGDTKGRYLKKSEFGTVKKMAQQDYIRSLLRDARQWETALTKSLALIPKNPLSETCTRHPCRRNIIEPIYLTAQELKNDWLTEEYETNQFRLEEKIYPTKTGIMVRSKSEKIIADMLFDAGIPYRYECAVTIQNKTVYPDFTILDVHKRRLILWEHLGMMDDMEYLIRNLKKMALYIKAGYKIGNTLMISSESGDAPLDIEEVKDILRKLR